MYQNTSMSIYSSSKQQYTNLEGKFKDIYAKQIQKLGARSIENNNSNKLKKI